MDKKSYNECLKELNEKERMSQINFLLNNELFAECNKLEFINGYYNLFAKKKIFIHQKIISMEIDPKSIYIIKNGEYLITTNKSMFEIEEFIKSYGININSDLSEESINTNPEYYKFMKERKYFKVSK